MPSGETIHSTGEDNNPQVSITKEEMDGIKEDARNSASPEASGQTPISPEKKAKHNEGFKKCVAAAVAGALVISLAISSMQGGKTASTSAAANELEPPKEEDRSPVLPEELNDLEEPSVIPGVAETLDLQDAHETEVAKGLRDGYDKKGMFLSGKKGPMEAFDFAVASEVAEVYNNDELEMTKGTAENQVESLSDYTANLPDAVKPAEFKDLGMLEIESKLESMSAEDYDASLKQFKEIIDKAFTERVTISGDYQNAFMRLKDESKPVTHDNMELVQCVTHEENLEVVRLYWLSEDQQTEIGSMLIKMTPVYDEEGNIISYKGCMQVLTKLGENPEVYKDIPPIPPNPDNPDKPDNPDEPEEWGKGGNTHAGGNRGLSGEVGESINKEENDNTNTGNQGGTASAPGSSSGGSKSGNNERKQGGSNQGSGTKAGNNSAPKGNPSSDKAGNQKQQQSQTTNKAGGDNNSNKAEEQKVKDGDF